MRTSLSMGSSGTDCAPAGSHTSVANRTKRNLIFFIMKWNVNGNDFVSSVRIVYNKVYTKVGFSAYMIEALSAPFLADWGFCWLDVAPFDFATHLCSFCSEK